ncbi:cyanophycin synthetase [Burkholderiaceae bacterium DAT-1]|nr:cyanophycin synthetase [Burkholderiaceae bacterium DAT-1]
MDKRDITIRRITHLRGPNIWTYRPVIEALVDIGTFEDAPSNLLPGFSDRLKAWLPGMVEHRCGVGEYGGFFMRLDEGTWMGHILEHVCIELQNLAGLKVGFGKARSTSERGVYKVAVRARDEQVAEAAFRAARELVLAAVEDRPFDVESTVAELKDMVDRHYLGPSTACIVDGATQRRIPSIRLNEGNLVQLGQGCRQRRIWTAETDRTSAIAEGIASDKDLTKRLLASCGVPVPEGEIVESAEEAWEAAQSLGLPVVVKPTDGNHGRGISIELSTRESIEEAFVYAEQHGSEVMVEKFIPGNEHRLLVVGGKVVAAARGETAWLTGDGVLSIRQLVERDINSDPRRGTTELHPLGLVDLDSDTAIQIDLSRQGLTPDSVPEAGRKVLLQRNGNVAFDVTAHVHPEVAATAALAARVVGLDIAGVDMVIEDVSKPMHKQAAAIVEVNAGPGLLMHLMPASGESQPVGRAIVDHLFQGDASGRIPVIGIAGSQHGSLISRLVAWILHLSGTHVGVACSDGFFLDHRCVERGNRAHFEAGQRVLINRMVEAAIFENGARQILAEGLAYDRCQIGVVTDFGGLPDLAEFDIRNSEQLYNVMRTQVDVVLSDGVAVLNAGDEDVAALAELSDGEVILYGMNDSVNSLASHLTDGGRAVLIRAGRVVLAQGGSAQEVLELAALPTVAGAALPVEALLPAIATAWALNIEASLIGEGIESFMLDQSTSLTALKKVAIS